MRCFQQRRCGRGALLSSALLLSLVTLVGGCARRGKPKLYVPRHCITAVELSEQTVCYLNEHGGLHCEGLKLTYACTEVKHDGKRRGKKN